LKSDDYIRKEFEMKTKELKDRTKQFAHRCVELAMVLPNTIYNIKY